MVAWLLMGLGLFLVQIYLSALIFLPAEGLTQHAGGRDNLPDKGIYAGRADRALANLKENLPIFLTLGLLSVIVEGADTQRAVLGAQIFVIGRVAYLGMYLAAIPWTRSAAYMVSMFGLLLMLLAIL